MFQYIEHGILKYDFVYDIDMYLFQVLPLLPWTSEFSKINIVMYFSHCFPLTSHIRGHILSCKMALLRPSTDTQCVNTKKDKMDGSGHIPIDVDVYSYISILTYFFYRIIRENSQLFPMKPTNHS